MQQLECRFCRDRHLIFRHKTDISWASLLEDQQTDYSKTEDFNLQVLYPFPFSLSKQRHDRESKIYIP